MSRVLNMTGVVADGTVPQVYVPFKQALYLDRATDVRINLSVFGASGSLYDLTNDVIVLSVRKHELDVSASLSRLLVPVGTGGAFTLSQTDTNISGGAYLYDVRRQAASTGLTDTIVPESLF